MGMYDTIICEYPLPDGYTVKPGDSFQTKSLDCLLYEYTITKDGRLFLEVYDYINVPEEERPYYGTPEFTGLGKLVGAIRRENKRISYLDDYTGDITFYTSDPHTSIWYEYIAQFSGGLLQSIKRAELPDDLCVLCGAKRMDHITTEHPFILISPITRT